MENLTREQTIVEHRKMWNWIAEQINKVKKIQDIPDLKDDYTNIKETIILYDCYLCEYTRGYFHRCGEICPLDWSDGDCIKSEYGKCKSAETWEEQYELALKIANLEERKFDDEN